MKAHNWILLTLLSATLSCSEPNQKEIVQDNNIKQLEQEICQAPKYNQAKTYIIAEQINYLNQLRKQYFSDKVLKVSEAKKLEKKYRELEELSDFFGVNCKDDAELFKDVDVVEKNALSHLIVYSQRNVEDLQRHYDLKNIPVKVNRSYEQAKLDGGIAGITAIFVIYSLFLNRFKRKKYEERKSKGLLIV